MQPLRKFSPSWGNASQVPLLWGYLCSVNKPSGLNCLPRLDASGVIFSGLSLVIFVCSVFKGEADVYVSPGDKFLARSVEL